MFFKNLLSRFDEKSIYVESKKKKTFISCVINTISILFFLSHTILTEFNNLGSFFFPFIVFEILFTLFLIFLIYSKIYQQLIVKMLIILFNLLIISIYFVNSEENISKNKFYLLGLFYSIINLDFLSHIKNFPLFILFITLSLSINALIFMKKENIIYLFLLLLAFITIIIRQYFYEQIDMMRILKEENLIQNVKNYEIIINDLDNKGEIYFMKKSIFF